MRKPGAAARCTLLLIFFGAVLHPGDHINAQRTNAHYFVDCSQTVNGDGSQKRPWNSLTALSEHVFVPGEVAALRRGVDCHGSLVLHGSGNAQARVRLTAYGTGPRPRIIAGAQPTQAVLLKNAGYWQIDSLDISGGNTYGLLVTGDEERVFGHITLRNLIVHDVFGGEVKDKDNGLVVFLRGSQRQRFDHVLIEDVVAAHTNQWAGIMMGAGKYYSDENGYNRDVVIRNSVAHDVYGDGIILFRVRDGLIDSSTAWLTGQQPTQNIGTPNAIWTWSCTDCTVSNNESFLTDSPGVDGGAYDIDWATTRNTVEHNYAHDTQGYCVAVFGAGYVTHDAMVRGNLCVDNGLSPRLSALQGAIYIHTWNGGTIDGVTIEKNTIEWNPPTPAAPLVNDGETPTGRSAAVVRDNLIHSASPHLLESSGRQLDFRDNRYDYEGLARPFWSWNGKKWYSLSALQAAGGESGSTLEARAEKLTALPHPARGEQERPGTSLPHDLRGLDGRALQLAPAQIRLITSLRLQLDPDGLISPATMARLSVLRTLTHLYNPRQLRIVVLVSGAASGTALENALLDLDTPTIVFARMPSDQQEDSTCLVDSDGQAAAQWKDSSSNLNAATIGYAVRKQLGIPDYAQLDSRP